MLKKVDPRQELYFLVPSFRTLLIGPVVLCMGALTLHRVGDVFLENVIPPFVKKMYKVLY